MLSNYLLTALRSLRKHYFYSFINIIGLALGVAVVLQLSAWVQHETRYDSFHEAKDDIYRGAVEFNFGGQVRSTHVTPTLLLPTVIANAPEGTVGTRVFNPSAWNPFIVKRDDKLFQETRFFMADSTFFRVFSFTLVQGSEATALKEPYSVILTASMKNKYFGAEDPIGKILNVNGSRDYVVTGVMDDTPSNSTLSFDFLASFHSLPAGREDPAWFPANFLTFVRTPPDYALGGTVEKVNAQVMKDIASELSGAGDYVRFSFVPLTEIHLYEEGTIRYIYIFGIVALLVLIIACINYVNLATARATDRAKEVGLRKVVGAAKTQLFGQFMGESALITLAGFALAYGIALTTLPFFNSLTGKELGSDIFFSSEYLVITALLLIVVILLSGAYPAVVMTSLQTLSTLKGSFKSGAKGLWLRKGLVVAQFVVSLLLLVGAIVIVNQLDYIQNKELGFDRENILIMPMDRKTGDQFEALRSEVLRSGRVLYLGRATESPTNIQGGYGVAIEGGGDHPELLVTAVAADEQFIPSLGMRMVEGRNFLEADLEKVIKDTVHSYIVNESFLSKLALPLEDAVGTRMRLSGRTGQIIGVVKDFHFATLHKPIEPLVVFCEPWQLNFMFARLAPGDPTPALEQLRSIVKTMTPHRPFEYRFVDDQYATLYTAETRMRDIVTVFAVLALVIAALGLLGLVSFAAAQKTKEIGIRKVLGATPGTIVLLITRDFTQLVLVAVIAGVPLSYAVMNEWLKNFAYQAPLTPAPFVLAGAACIALSFLAAGYQALKASHLDPAQTLRAD